MKKQEAVNTFTKGIISDLNPLTMPNDTLSNCLNGTMLTYNGNEMVLQNDMGNARVETAMLPTGYIPLGSTSFGGIIYIISYNPIEKKCQIGSFPSPERNLSKDDLGDKTNPQIELDYFCEGEWTDKLDDSNRFYNNTITSYYQKVNLCREKVYTGDKYKVFSPNINDDSKYISAWDKDNSKYDINDYPKYLKFDIISTLDDGKIIELTNDSVWTSNNGKPYYYIYNGNIELNTGELDLDEYRALVGSNYDTYVSKLSGKLGIVARLEVPTSFSVGYQVLTETNGEKEYYQFYFLLNWANDNKGKSKSKVNPNFITFDKNDFGIIELKNVDKEIIAPNDYYKDTFELKAYLEDCKNNITENDRKNDGTDFDYVVKGFKIKIDKDSNNNIYSIIKDSTEIKIDGSTLNLKITPTMKFGKLKFLEKNLVIDLDLINKGIFRLDNYQYYVDSNNIRMLFNLDSYPKEGERIKGLSIQFFPLENEINDYFLDKKTYSEDHTTSNFKNSTDKDSLEKSDYYLIDGSEPIASYVLNGNISGTKEIVIDTDIEEYKKLEKDRIYLVKFVLNCQNQPKVWYRLFFNCTMFNSKWGESIDFKDIYLSDVMNVELKLDKDSPADQHSQIIEKKENDTPTGIEDIPVIELTPKDESKYEHRFDIIKKVESNFQIVGNQMQDYLEINGVINKRNDEEEGIIEVEDWNGNLNPDNFKFNIIKNILSFTKTFEKIVPYTIRYESPILAPIYIKENLTTNRDDIELSHYSYLKDRGEFNLKINGETQWSQNFANESKGEIVNLSAPGLFLSKYIESNNLDFLTLKFGIDQIQGDRNRGYQHKISYGGGIITASQDFVTQKNKGDCPYLNSYVVLNCFQDDSYAMLASTIKIPENKPSAFPNNRLTLDPIFIQDEEQSKTIPPHLFVFGNFEYLEDTDNYVNGTNNGLLNSKLRNYPNSINGSPEEAPLYVDQPLMYTAKFDVEKSIYKLFDREENPIFLHIDFYIDNNYANAIKVELKFKDNDTPYYATVDDIRGYKWTQYEIDITNFKSEDGDSADFNQELEYITYSVNQLGFHHVCVDNIYFYQNSEELPMRLPLNDIILPDFENLKESLHWFQADNTVDDMSLANTSLVKYTNSNEQKTVFGITDVIGERNPVINITYTFNVIPTFTGIKIKDKTINYKDEKGNDKDVPNNLHFCIRKNDSYIPISMKEKVILNNKDWIDPKYHLPSYEGFNEDGDILTSNDLNKIYYPTNEVYPYLIIKNEKVVSNIKNYYQHKFQFAWEDTDSVTASSSKQYYNVQYIYSPKEDE